MDDIDGAPREQNGAGAAIEPSSADPAFMTLSLRDHPLELVDIAPDSTHILAPKETPTQRLISRIRQLDFSKLLQGQSQHQEADGSHTAEGLPDGFKQDHFVLAKTVKPPEEGGQTAVVQENDDQGEVVASQKLQQMREDVLMHLNTACHEVWVIRELINMMLYEPELPPTSTGGGGPPGGDPTHFHKVLHPVHFPKPPIPMNRQLDDAAFALRSKRDHLSSAADLLRTGVKRLAQSLAAEAQFFIREAIPLRNLNWRLRLRNSTTSAGSSGTVFGGGMYIDYGYDDFEDPSALNSGACADILRVFRDQVVDLPQEAGIVSISPSLQLALGSGGKEPLRLRVEFKPKRPRQQTPAVFQQFKLNFASTAQGDADAKDPGENQGPPMPASTLPTSVIDGLVREAQETYYHKTIFARLCDQVHAVHNVTLRDKVIVHSLGNYGSLHISLAPVSKSSSRKRKRNAQPPRENNIISGYPLEELLLTQRMGLKQFCDWVQFRLFTRELLALIEGFLETANPAISAAMMTSFMDSSNLRQRGSECGRLSDLSSAISYARRVGDFGSANPSTGLSRDMDPDGLIVSVHFPETNNTLQIALQPPSILTVRVPTSGRHVVVVDPPQIVQLMQHQASQEIAKLVRSVYETTVFAEKGGRAQTGEDDDEDDDIDQAAEDPNPSLHPHQQLRVDVTWVPCLTVMVNHASVSTFSEGWVEKVLVSAGLV